MNVLVEVDSPVRKLAEGSLSLELYFEGNGLSANLILIVYLLSSPPTQFNFSNISRCLLLSSLSGRLPWPPLDLNNPFIINILFSPKLPPCHSNP